jgi:hypothetical protein
MYFDDGEGEPVVPMAPLTEAEERQQRAQWEAYERQLQEDSRSLCLVRDEPRMQSWEEQERRERDEQRLMGRGDGGKGGRKRGADELPTCHYTGCQQTYRNKSVTCPHPRNTGDKLRAEYPDLEYQFCSTRCVVDFAHYEAGTPEATDPILEVMRVRHPGISIAPTKSPMEAMLALFAGQSLADTEKTRAVGTSAEVTWIEKRDKTIVSKNGD